MGSGKTLKTGSGRYRGSETGPYIWNTDGRKSRRQRGFWDSLGSDQDNPLPLCSALVLGDGVAWVVVFFKYYVPVPGFLPRFFFTPPLTVVMPFENLRLTYYAIHHTSNI